MSANCTVLLNQLLYCPLGVVLRKLAGEKINSLEGRRAKDWRKKILSETDGKGEGSKECNKV